VGTDGKRLGEPRTFSERSDCLCEEAAEISRAATERSGFDSGEGLEQVLTLRVVSGHRAKELEDVGRNLVARGQAFVGKRDGRVLVVVGVRRIGAGFEQKLDDSSV